MASGLKFIKEHIKAIGNIKKITSSMKLISATKFLRSEKNLMNARPFGLGTRHFYKVNPIKIDINKVVLIHFCPITSDRGLCGSLINVLCKNTRKILPAEKNNYKMICIGEKTRLNFAWDMPETIALVVNGVGHRIPTFLDASLIAKEVLSIPDFVYGKILFARYVNIVSYEFDELQLYTVPLVASAKELENYENEDEIIDYYLEFSVASLFFYALSETFTVELASRMNAMSNASKNASDFGKKLKRQYNRLRQSLVTRELIDIVSGAQVVSGQ